MTYPSDDPYPCSVATIGFFDGVHVGHRCLINQVRRCATARGLFSLIITFDAHPRNVLQPDNRLPLLSTPEEKYALLSDTGADGLLVLPFTRELSSLSAKEFMQEVLYKQLNVRVLVIGYDHRFGRGRAATFEDYEVYGREIGMEVVQAEAYMGDDRPVSSSFVRSLLAEGNVEAAAQCLSYGYSLSGTVVSGFRVGHKIGYPTANLQVDDDRKQIPGRGVYAVRVWLDGQQAVPYGGMLNVGFRPTLDNGPQASIEVNIFDFIGDLYGKRLKVEFVSRLRPEHRFDNLQALQQQLTEDEVRARRLLSHV